MIALDVLKRIASSSFSFAVFLQTVTFFRDTYLHWPKLCQRYEQDRYARQSILFYLGSSLLIGFVILFVYLIALPWLTWAGWLALGVGGWLFISLWAAFRILRSLGRSLDGIADQKPKAE